MLTKLLSTIFLALGLAMIWLGFFYHYEFKKQSAVVQETLEEPLSDELEFYTLADEHYAEGDDPLSGLELDPLHITDFSISTLPEHEGLSESKGSVEEGPGIDMEAEIGNRSDLFREGTLENFPVVLAMAGALFMICGVCSCKGSKA